MIIAITGTPGIGKTSVTQLLKEKHFKTVDLNKLALEKKLTVGYDKNRDTHIVDIKKLNKCIEEKYHDENLLFLDGHLSHLLKTVDKIIIFRCHPDELKKRLGSKSWKTQKINENIQAETLDVILCETLDIHPKGNVFEIDTTKKTPKQVFNSVIEIINNDFKPMKKYNTGKVDWSEEIIKNNKLWQ